MSSSLPESSACPSCSKHFIHSSLLQKSEKSLTLHCRICDNDYHLPNTESQRLHLSNDFGEPSQVEQLLDIRQLSCGDVIAYRRKVVVFKYQHHAVVTKVDYSTGHVDTVEFAPDLPLKKGRVIRSTKSFGEDIQSQNAWIRRYMPLDCLPVGEVLTKADGFITNPDSQPKYDLFLCNCQHLSSWCKTGKMKSGEAGKARRFYHFVFHGLQIFSIFANPPIAIGMLVWTVGDAITRVGRVCRTELELIDKEMKTNFEVYAPLIASLILSGVFVATTVAVAKKRKHKSDR